MITLEPYKSAAADKRVKRTEYGVMLDGHYEIEWHRAADERSILNWIAHLSTSDKITKAMLVKVIEELTEYHGIHIDW